ncbi:MAG TPA: CbtA family protein [Acidimicrobiales bacterium]|nr:CbtA family protein [Acidimicrobiales bacterium]
MLARFDFTRPRTIVVAAVVLGAVAGLAGAVFHSVATEPRIDEAIAIEEAAAEAAPTEPGADHADGDDEDVSVSRGDQRGVGLFAAYALTGAAFGLFLAIASLSLRTTTGGPFRRVAVSGAILAGAVSVAPWLKYPPNPPAVGDPDTVGERERLYVLMIVLAALALAGLAHLSARLRRAGWPDDRRVAAVVLAGLVTFGVLFAALPPSPDTVGVPANLVWQFRLNSLTGNLLVWTLLTLGLGVVWTEAARSAARATERAAQNSMPLSAEIPSS